VTEPDPLKKLMSKAGSLLARRSYSCGEMRRKLLSSGNEVQADQVVTRLRQLNLLNDGDYAYNFAFARMNQDGWGSLKVLHALLSRQIPASLAEAAIERVQSEGEKGMFLARYLDHYFRRKESPRDRKSLRKLIAHLRRRGFREDEIYSALRGRLPAEVWSRFDTGDDLA
jgi:SOS response regulatory protein OraA/RecX